MSIVLMPTSAEQLAKIITFLDESKIASHIPCDYHPMESEDLFTDNQEQISALVTAVNNKSLVPAEMVDRGGWNCYVSKEYPTTLWFKPTPKFKTFCGAEFCNPLGYITLDMAEAVVILHAKAHSSVISTHVTLTSDLQDVLETNASKLSMIELRRRFQELFTAVPQCV